MGESRVSKKEERARFMTAVKQGTLDAMTKRQTLDTSAIDLEPVKETEQHWLNGRRNTLPRETNLSRTSVCSLERFTTCRTLRTRMLPGPVVHRDMRASKREEEVSVSNKQFNLLN